MWRAGGLTMAVLGILPFNMTLSMDYSGGIRRLFEVLVNLVAVFSAAILWVAVLGYPAISGFLTVESLKQLFYLPESAFKLPDFSIYLPHIA